MFEDIFKKLKVWSEESILDEVIIIAVIIALSETFAQNFIRSSERNDHMTMFFGLTFYILVGFLLHHAYNHYPLSRVNITWSSMSIIIAVLTGYFIYNEKITFNTIMSVVGAIIAIYFSTL
jgi:multidrug transporter EmrE-like cation transporter